MLCVLQTLFTHRSVSRFDRVPFQLTDEHVHYGRTRHLDPTRKLLFKFKKAAQIRASGAPQRRRQGRADGACPIDLDAPPRKRASRP
tara:strand:- start:1 stop:261 length:261 start_codon:yes stop_codon:yes gene_type:complete